MKLAFQRARPTFDEPLLTLSTYSFPSGHVLASTLLYGLVRRLGVRAHAAPPAGGCWRSPARWWRSPLVAFTRMYLGVHYLTDVGAALLRGHRLAGPLPDRAATVPAAPPRAAPHRRGAA